MVRKTLLFCFLILIIIYGAYACTVPQPVIKEIETPTPILPAMSMTSARLCTPTPDDGVSPSYVANAPERTVVGHGHVVSGVVLSSVDCQPIAHAKLEFWPEEGNIGHPNSSRATFYTDKEGHYRFECNPPDHIHMRISAPGYRTIGVNSYHPDGQAEGTFDIVLEPE